MEQPPSQPPPSYEASTSTSAGRPTASANHHRERNGIPPASRRSMEDELRPLPDGWVRQFDQKAGHQFFVDTKASPPRSIWQHPYDDDEYLGNLSPQERENLTRLHHSVSLKDIEAESSDDEHHNTPSRTAPGGQNELHGLHKFTRKMKDRVTHSTHAEREAARQKRAIEEQKAYEAHLASRRALSRAIETGQPQFLGKDRDGRDVYIESPYGPSVPAGVRGYNPYAQGPYLDPNARFVRPEQPYSRPYGYGYGGGYGFPLVGGLVGGALLGGLLF
jgi:hypothetical protein